jgi:hypothetical protein
MLFLVLIYDVEPFWSVMLPLNFFLDSEYAILY